MDELTGLANRRPLLDELGHQAGRADPSHLVGVVYFDLDHFKHVNDTHGHDQGDQVLRAVAGIAGRIVRDYDLVARIGGEELVLVAPATTHAEAVQLAERLRAALPIELEATLGVRLTASFGVTDLAPDERRRACCVAWTSSCTSPRPRVGTGCGPLGRRRPAEQVARR